MLRVLLARLPRYGPPCRDAPCGLWSDVPLWDAVAALQAGSATGRDAEGLRVARAAFAAVDGATVYAGGACPALAYQQPFGGANRLKTLETDANYVRAALMLYSATRERPYLRKARARYAAIRDWFWERETGLYTVYLFDDGIACRRLPRRTFASVNGIMIWNGLELAERTGEPRYRAEAFAAARALDLQLNDAAGVFADLQAENDTAEPLSEAMLRLAREPGGGFARAWILRNARASAGARNAAGDYGRFFDGPPPLAPTAWQIGGGFALAIAAAALAPSAESAAPPFWRAAHAVTLRATRLPATFAFTGSGVAILGTLGERCCEAGRARVLVDGVETFDRTGTWQNKSSAALALPRSTLFAWRWPRRGRHVLRFLPDAANAKEGGPFLDARIAIVR